MGNNEWCLARDRIRRRYLRGAGALGLIAVIGISTLAGARADDLQFNTWKSPSGNGCIGFCAQLSNEERRTLKVWINEASVMQAISDARIDAGIAKGIGLGVKNLGYVSEVAGGARPDPTGVGFNLLGRNLQDAGDFIGKRAEETLTKRIILELHKKYNDIISPGGIINRDELRKINDGELAFVFTNSFKEEIGDPAILSELYSHISVDMLVESLRDTSEIKESVDNLDQQIKLNSKALEEINVVQKKILATSKAEVKFLGGIQEEVLSSKEIVEQLAVANLRPAQVVALIDSGALNVKKETADSFRRNARMEQVRGDFNQAAAVFGGFTQSLSDLGLTDLAKATNDISKLLTTGGAFAAAYISGDPISIAQTGLGLAGAISSFGKKPGPVQLRQKAGAGPHYPNASNGLVGAS